MKITYIAIIFTAIAVAALSGASPGTVIPERLEQDIVRQIREKTLPVYKKYIGVESTREIVSRQYDSRDNSYRGGYTVLLRRREYFYRKATYKVLKYEKNGKPEPAWKYNYPTRSPAYLPFGPDTDANYATRLKGKKTIEGIPCWKFEVMPKKNTSRHMKGFIYFSINGLDLVYLEGTVAYYPPGLKSLAMAIFFKKLDDAYVMSKGSYTFVVHVPLFYPHRKFEQTFTSGGDRMIPAKP
ncbi:MAG: hypothetical protein KA369_06665 [Spirochaetes bacterium]|nr:hypothetical protein [Spirochaetota bacterium]